MKPPFQRHLLLTMGSILLLGECFSLRGAVAAVNGYDFNRLETTISIAIGYRLVQLNFIVVPVSDGQVAASAFKIFGKGIEERGYNLILILHLRFGSLVGLSNRCDRRTNEDRQNEDKLWFHGE